jgi:hypothetical protein
MGMDCRIVFAQERTPAWPTIAERLAARGLDVQVRMIDGDLCLPEETPPETWQDLRLGTAHGMVTLRREPEGMRLMIWGNAPAELLQERDHIASAIVELTKGSVQT